MRLTDRGSFGSGVVIGLVIGLVIAAAIGVLTGLLGRRLRLRLLEAQETIEDNYFEAVEPSELEDASIAGMVRELKKRYKDRFSHYFAAEQLEEFEAATWGGVHGRRPDRHRGPEGAAGRRRLSGHRRRRRPACRRAT